MTIVWDNNRILAPSTYGCNALSHTSRDRKRQMDEFYPFIQSTVTYGAQPVAETDDRY